MGKEVRLVLRQKEMIRGKEYPAGTLVFQGAVAGVFTPADIEKRIQSKGIRVDEKCLAPEPSKKETKEPEKTQNQGQK